MVLAACGNSATTASTPTAAARPGAVAITAPTPATAPTGTASVTAPALSAEPGRHLQLVAIGDSLAQGKASGCPGCTDYIDLYGQALGAATGDAVDVDNRAAVELSALPPVQARQLLNDILTDGALRQALAGADVVVISVGFNDTPWNRFDNPCDAANAEATVVAWDKITSACTSRVAGEFKATLDEILSQIDELRGCATPPGESPDFCSRAGHKNTLIRIVTVFDDWIGEPGTPAAALAPTEAADRAFVAAQCWDVAEHGGRCADAYRALNGAHGTADAAPFLVADHTHLNASGHRQIADALDALGFDPLP
jgi:lysophospholipase L1-like esterase